MKIIFMVFSIIFIIDIHLINTKGNDYVKNSKAFLLHLFTNKCNCRCGVPNRQGRILGGEITKQYEYPWFAYIQTNKNGIIPAALINNKYVVTSASLLRGLTPFDIKILLGVENRCTPDISSSTVSVNSITVHQLYSSLNEAHDIALVKLNTQVNFDNRISPICLPIPGRTYLGEVATVIGWTNTDMSTLTNCRPLKLGLPILNQNLCSTTSPDKTYFSNDKGCVGVVGASSGICKDDGGSPVMYRDRDGIYELIGVLSDKNACGNPPSTAMYTKLQGHIDWIKANTEDACYCLKI